MRALSAACGRGKADPRVGFSRIAPVGVGGWPPVLVPASRHRVLQKGPLLRGFASIHPHRGGLSQGPPHCWGAGCYQPPRDWPRAWRPTRRQRGVCTITVTKRAATVSATSMVWCPSLPVIPGWRRGHSPHRHIFLKKIYLRRGEYPRRGAGIFNRDWRFNPSPLNRARWDLRSDKRGATGSVRLELVHSCSYQP